MKRKSRMDDPDRDTGNFEHTTQNKDKQNKKYNTENLRNNSWKPYVYIVFTMGRPLCHKVLPRALARGKKLT